MKQKTQRQTTSKTAALICCIFAALITTPITSHAQDTTTGLVGHWTLDETSGTTAADSSGNGLDGTITAPTTSVEGIISTALDFNGTTNQIEVPANATLRITGDVTLSAWVFKRGSGALEGIMDHVKNGETAADNVLYAMLSDGPNDIVWFHENGAGNDTRLNFPTQLPQNQWIHVSMVRNDSEKNVTLYINGGASGTQSYTNSAEDGSSGILGIGTNRAISSRFDGIIDDVRIYNRALTAQDAATLHDRTTQCTNDTDAGKLIYNENYRAMQYCNGDDWQSIGKGASILHGEKTIGEDYDINAVYFNNTNLGINNIGATDGRALTFSTWLNRDNLSENLALYLCNASGSPTNETCIDINFIFNQLRIRAGAGDDSGNLYEAFINNFIPTANEWHHILISFDLDNPGSSRVYLNDTSVAHTPSTFTSGLIGFSRTRHLIGGTGNSDIEGSLADFWLDMGGYLDFDIEANRRKFINAKGQAINLGADGSGPTGSAPDVFLSGDTDDWHTNKGTGGGFTENVALTDATSLPPSESAQALVGWWRLDETEGTTAADSSGNGNDGTLQGGLDFTNDSVSGPINKGLSITGSELVTIPLIPNYQNMTALTVAVWFKTNNDGAIFFDEIGIGRITRLRLAGGRLRFQLEDDFTNFYTSTLHGAIGEFSNNEWHHFVATADTTTNEAKQYINGIEVTNDDISALVGFIGPDSTQLVLGNGSEDGNIDDVRLYNFALDADQIAELYAASRIIPSYIPNAINFDGTTNQRIRNNFTAPSSDGTAMTGSFWIRKAGSTSEDVHVMDAEGGGVVYVQSNGSIDFRFRNSASTNNALRLTANSAIDDNEWHHVLFSFDVTNSSNRYVYVDDQSVSLSVTDFTNESLQFNPNNFTVLGQRNGTNPANVDFSEFWFDYGTFIDLSVEANRRNFISADGYPVNLDADGSLPTGAAPDVYLNNPAASIGTNLGSGGGFSIADGNITDVQGPTGIGYTPRYCTSPSQPEGTLIYNTDQNVMQYCDGFTYRPLGPQGDGGGGCSAPSGVAGMMFYNEDFKSLIYCEGDEWIGVGRDPTNDLLADGLVGHWKLDEDSGIFTDSSGSGNNGTGIGGFTYASNGIVENATTFDGVDGHITTADIDKSAAGEITLSAWVRKTGTCNATTLCYVAVKDQFTSQMPYGIIVANNTRFYAGNNVNTIAADITTGEWTHIVGVIRDGTSAEIYIDGTLANTNNSLTLQTNDEPFSIGSAALDPTSRAFPGDIDDVRIYDRALSAGEIQALYNLGDCPAIGDTCNDGTLYAGLSPDGDVRMFTTPANAGLFAWNNGNTSGYEQTNISTNSAPFFITGEANTAALVTIDSDNSTPGNQPHLAAQHCYDLITHGYDDWYLPSQIELSTFLGTPAVNSVTGLYWVSSERSIDRGEARNFNGTTVTSANVPKNLNLNVRCVRKD